MKISLNQIIEALVIEGFIPLLSLLKMSDIYSHSGILECDQIYALGEYIKLKK
jgi:hypothetical protein